MQAYLHDGFWQPMDTLRDKNQLEELWAAASAPWKNCGMTCDAGFWGGKRVFVTGHTGFKGSWLRCGCTSWARMCRALRWRRRPIPTC